MVGTGGRGNSPIEPAHGLLQPGQGFLRLIRQQINQRRRCHLLGTDLTVALEAMPIGVAEGEARSEGLGQLLGRQISDRWMGDDSLWGARRERGGEVGRYHGVCGIGRYLYYGRGFTLPGGWG